MMTKLEPGEEWGEENAAMFKKQTYYYNREHDDGDITGRVPVTKTKEWEVLFINDAHMRMRL